MITVPHQAPTAAHVRCCVCDGAMADGGVRMPADHAYKPGERTCATCWQGVGRARAFLAACIATAAPSPSSPECPDCRQATLDPFGGCTDAACPSNDLFRPRTLLGPVPSTALRN